jgi:hypothetical protein
VRLLHLSGFIGHDHYSFYASKYLQFAGKLVKRSILISLGIVLVAIIAFGAWFYTSQMGAPKTTFEVLSIQTPQYEVGLEKPAAYINLSVKNNEVVNETGVVVKLSGGFTNSSDKVPDELFLVTTQTINVIRPRETVTTPKIFSFGWYFFYRIEVSSSDGTKEVFDQWVQWRSWTVPLPSGG